MSDTESEYYIVEKVVDKRFKGGKVKQIQKYIIQSYSNVHKLPKLISMLFEQHEQVQYLIKWLDYPDSDNTWEPLGNLDCDTVKDFEDLRKEEKTLNSPKTVCKTDNLNERTHKHNVVCKLSTSIEYILLCLMDVTEVSSHNLLHFSFKLQEKRKRTPKSPEVDEAKPIDIPKSKTIDRLKDSKRSATPINNRDEMTQSADERNGMDIGDYDNCEHDESVNIDRILPILCEIQFCCCSVLFLIELLFVLGSFC